MGRFFALFVAFHYFLLAGRQNVAFTSRYGWGAILKNVIAISLVGFTWLEEAVVGKNQLVLEKMAWRKSRLFLPALFAFWFPIDIGSFRPNFHLGGFFGNFAGFTFCVMTPLYLLVLLLSYPWVNVVTMRVVSLVGLIIGSYNLFLNFFLDLERLWWKGIVHLPLFFFSLYAFLLSLKVVEKR